MTRKGHKQPKHHPNKDHAYLDRIVGKQTKRREQYLDPVDLRTAHDAQLSQVKLPKLTPTDQDSE